MSNSETKGNNTNMSINNNNSSSTINVLDILHKRGYMITKKIATTLQGNAYLGRIINDSNNESCVIKVTSKLLYNKGITLNRSGKIITIKEDIIKEISIMKYLQTKKPPQGFIKCIDSFMDDDNIVLIMDYGGNNFFEYIRRNTISVKNGNLSAKKWVKKCKKMFKQICIYVKWLHNNGICHLDISLENCVTKNDTVYIIDFGLAEVFAGNDFKCNKYVGKLNYQSPEIYRKKEYFDGSKADIWSLGVLLFMILTGTPLYKKPSTKDPYYCNVKYGFLKCMVNQWDLNDVFDDITFDLLNNIFVDERKRFNINDVLNHEFFEN